MNLLHRAIRKGLITVAFTFAGISALVSTLWFLVTAISFVVYIFGGEPAYGILTGLASIFSVFVFWTLLWYLVDHESFRL